MSPEAKHFVPFLLIISTNPRYSIALQLFNIISLISLEYLKINKK